MTRAELQSLLAACFAPYREWSYSQWVDRIHQEEQGPEASIAPDGTIYQFEVQAFWDNHSQSNIRVCAYIWAEPQKRMLGCLPIYFPDVSDAFIIRPDGSFVEED